MKIYTKRGDEGQTGLFGGERVSKDNLRIRAYGTLDELNAFLGLAQSELAVGSALQDRLGGIQAELFQLGAELATPRGGKLGVEPLDESAIALLEQEIDRMEAELPPLKNFILPGGSRGASLLHVARTVSRRAEREMVSLNRAEPLRPPVLQYINRLSDFLFVAARWVNFSSGVNDVPWVVRSRAQ
jgi:cob(I)alamin adenosyltransferase